MYIKPLSLRDLIYNHFRGRKDFVHYNELKQLAEENGYKISNLERRLRTESDGTSFPVRKFNLLKKPIRGSEAAIYYKWTGSTTILNSK